MPGEDHLHPPSALQKATELFWERGYDATSIQDLLGLLIINRFSLCDTFQGKPDLRSLTSEEERRRIRQTRAPPGTRQLRSST